MLIIGMHVEREEYEYMMAIFRRTLLSHDKILKIFCQFHAHVTVSLNLFILPASAIISFPLH